MLVRRTILLTALLACGLSSCVAPPPKPDAGPAPVEPNAPATALLDVVTLDPAGGPARAAPRQLSLAGRETVGLTLLVPANAPALRVRLTGPDGRRAPVGPAYLVAALPADLNRAAFVRQHGPPAGATGELPRALLPLRVADDRVELVQHPKAARPAGRADARLVWLDARLPDDAPVGSRWALEVEALDARGRATATLPIELSRLAFDLPARPALTVAGRVRWERLQAGFPGAFEAVTPRLVSRADARYAPAVKVMDACVALAQQHGLAAWVDRLQPTAKWPSGLPPELDWSDFDGLVAPWLNGDAFPDKRPVGLWPLPRVEYLDNYPVAARRQYLTAAAAHFDGRDWLGRAPLELAGDRPDALLADAALALSAHSRLRARLPLLGADVRFAAEGSPPLPRATDAARLVTAVRPLIADSPAAPSTQPVAPASADGPRAWLPTDGPLVPLAGGPGGSEQDARLWGWLAFLRGADLVPFDANVLPDGDDAATGGAWFYPGPLFGLPEDVVVPGLQLKWLRRAVNDHAYLALARARGEPLNARVMANIVAKPVELAPGREADPLYALMTGTADPAAWGAALPLLARTVELRGPDGRATPDARQRNALNLQLLQWVQPQERPIVVARELAVVPPSGAAGFARGGNERGPTKVQLRLALDLYNASDATAEGNALRFAKLPAGWTVAPQDVGVPPMPTYRVTRAELPVEVDVEALRPARDSGAVELTFVHGYTKQATPVPLRLPVARALRREGGLRLDGRLDDWTEDDQIARGPLAQMLDRPALQRHELRPAPEASDAFAGWSDDNLYVAFKVAGPRAGAAAGAQNFVRYDGRRAWFEDTVSVLLQPVYADGALGPVTVATAKPNGTLWVERQADGAWQPLGSAALRYACTMDDGAWRGELALPWASLAAAGYVTDAPGRRPVMVRFNLAHHDQARATSSTWAGPVDHGRDAGLAGVLVLRDERLR